MSVSRFFYEFCKKNTLSRLKNELLLKNSHHMALMFKQPIVYGLRKVRLLKIAEELRYCFDVARRYHSNRAFARSQPNFTFPPYRLLYEVKGTTNYEQYLTGGKKGAQKLYKSLSPFLPEKNATIAEWGCGVAQLVRHIPELGGGRFSRVIGTDYNKRMIDWCQKNITDVQFLLNGLVPPLPIDTGVLDCLYAVSVFTHLSEEMHFAWLDEMLRVVRPKGCLVITTMSDGCRFVLSKSELVDYQAGRLVVRGNVKEGSRLYSAYQSPAFMREKFLKGLEIIQHLPCAIKQKQDLWIVRIP